MEEEQNTHKQKQGAHFRGFNGTTNAIKYYYYSTMQRNIKH